MVYFVGGYYTPFSRAELKSYDPLGYEMVRTRCGTSTARSPRRQTDGGTEIPFYVTCWPGSLGRLAKAYRVDSLCRAIP